MQRYSFFVNRQNFWREKLKIYARFNSCLQLKRHIVDAHIILLYARETVFKDCKHRMHILVIWVPWELKINERYFQYEP